MIQFSFQNCLSVYPRCHVSYENSSNSVSNCTHQVPKVLKELEIQTLTYCDLNFVTCLISNTEQLESLEMALGSVLLRGNISLQKHLKRINFPGEYVFYIGPLSFEETL